MAKPSRPKESSDDSMMSSSLEGETVKDQVNDNDEKLIMVACTAEDSDNDEDVPVAAQHDDHIEEEEFVGSEIKRSKRARYRSVERENQEYDDTERQTRIEELLANQNATKRAESPLSTMKKRKQPLMDDYMSLGMERRRWFIIAIIICSVTFSSCSELKVTVKHKHNPKQHHVAKYNHTLATILVQYASAVYVSDLTELFTWTCPRCNGLTEGFEIIELIVDVKWCLQGFVGFAANLNSVVIAFKGTQSSSIQNWVEDLFWKQLDIDYPGVDGAMVHHGFYNAYNDSSLRPGVLSAIEVAKELYGDTNIIVTGHSMGGAIAALCGLDLRLTLGGQQHVQVMTFGQPRIGNAVFASYYYQVVPDTFRITHGQDMVPHLPPYYYYFPKKTYHHFPREVWLYSLAYGSFVYVVEKVCDDSGEDPTCSRSVSGNSIADHLIYYGVEMGSNDSIACRIVMDPSLAAYSRMDVDGNFILMKDSSTSLLKLNTDGGEITAT